MSTNEFRLPQHFRAAGVHAGIKADPTLKDMAMLVSDLPAAAAGMFTTNQVQAAPVKLDIAQLQDGTAQAVLVNSGNANACTGEQGMADAKEMIALTARALDLPEAEVLVCSTGSIGKPLNMEPIRKGIALLAAELSADGGMAAAEGILTTDTRHKVALQTIVVDGQTVTLSGLAKGAGMIEPNMATMLSYVLTDASVEPEALKTALREAVNRSFNRISVDGDTSTNDSVIVLANGAADHTQLVPGHQDWQKFQDALNDLVFDLAMQIVKDGEGMTRFITLKVRGALNDSDADVAVRAVANSLLVKTGWVGTYPVWGRIIDVLGYCRAHINPDRVAMEYDGLPVAVNGMAADTDPEALNAVSQSDGYTITMDLGTGGRGEAVLYTCDCTEEYVRINMF